MHNLLRISHNYPKTQRWVTVRRVGNSLPTRTYAQYHRYATNRRVGNSLPTRAYIQYHRYATNYAPYGGGQSAGKKVDDELPIQRRRK